MNAPRRRTVGITSTGSGVGQSIADSCRRSGLPLKLVGLGNNPFAFGAFDCDLRDTLPTIYAPDYIDILLEKCRAHRIDILLPGLDDELVPLARSRQRFRDAGIDLIVADEAMLVLCRDKARMVRELSPLADVFVETMSAAEARERASAGRLAFPLIAKPRAGFASRGVVVINSPDDIAELGEDRIVQNIAVPHAGDPQRRAYIDGLRRGVLLQVSEISVQIVLGRDGNEIGRMASCNRLAHGVPVDIVPVDVPEVWDAIDRLLPRFLELGLRGPLNIQGRLTDDGPRFFEMNARFTGITGLRALIGFNEVEAVLLDAFGERPVSAPPLRAHMQRIGLRQVADRVVDASLDPQLAQTTALICGRTVRRKPERRVLVTGANSYLGRATLRALLDAEGISEVVALVRDPARFADGREAPLPAGVTVIDATAPWSGGFSLGLVDVLVHLASGRPVHAPDALADSVRFTGDVMTLAARHQLPGIVNASSQAVYGLSRPPMWREDLPPAPETPYAQAKWAGELMASMVRRINTASAVTSLRLSQLFGQSDGMRWDEVPHLFVRKAMLGERICVQGGNQQLDYLNVDDAARAIVQAATRPFDRWPEVVNVGSGAPISLLDFTRNVVEVAGDILGRSIEFDVVPASIDTRLGMHIDAAREALHWRPETDCRATIRKLALHLPRTRRQD